MYNILVCDDEKDIVSALSIYLKSDGYQVYKAYNGKEALELVQKGDIHLVLMDIMMPEMDGIETAKRIMEMTDHTVPILFVTALCDRQTVTLCRNLDAAGYIVRPYKPVFVKTEIKRILMGRSEIE